jgi:tight adherence protein B
VGPEFRSLVEGSKVGVPFDQSLKRMYERMPLPEVNFFGIVLTIQQKTGGNLSETLGNLANVLRDRKRMKAKIQAMSSEAKASAAIIGSLPFAVMMLVYMSSPAYIMLLFSEKFGNLMLLGSGVWMTLGVLVMKKMLNFKF